MISWMDLMVQEEHLRELRREAERERLIRQARQAAETPRHRNPVLGVARYALMVLALVGLRAH